MPCRSIKAMIPEIHTSVPPQGTQVCGVEIEPKTTLQSNLLAFRQIGDTSGRVFTDISDKKGALLEFVGVPYDTVSANSVVPPHASVIHCGLVTIGCHGEDIKMIAVGDDIIADQRIQSNDNKYRKAAGPPGTPPTETFQIRKFNGNDLGPKPLQNKDQQSYRMDRHFIGRVFSRNYRDSTIDVLLHMQCHHRQYNDYLANKREFTKAYCKEEDDLRKEINDKNLETFLVDSDGYKAMGSYQAFKRTQSKVRQFLGVECGIPAAEGNELIKLQDSLTTEENQATENPAKAPTAQDERNVQLKLDEEFVLTPGRDNRFPATGAAAAAASKPPSKPPSKPRSRKRAAASVKATMCAVDKTEASAPSPKKPKNPSV